MTVVYVYILLCMMGLASKKDVLRVTCFRSNAIIAFDIGIDIGTDIDVDIDTDTLERVVSSRVHGAHGAHGTGISLRLRHIAHSKFCLVLSCLVYHAAGGVPVVCRSCGDAACRGGGGGCTRTASRPLSLSFRLHGSSLFDQEQLTPILTSSSPCSW